MANPIIRAVSPLAAVVDDVSDAVDAVEGFYTPYSPYPQRYVVGDPNMRDTIRLAALGLTPADLAPQPSPFTNSIRKIKNSQKKNSQNMDSINLAKNMHTPGDPTSFIKNSYAKYLKSTNKPDTLKLSDNSTGSGDIGVFDTPDNYTPITPNNSITGINTGMDTSKNPLVDSVKKEVNQNAKKDTGSVKVDVNPETIQPVLTPEEIGNYYATYGAKKSVPNPKTALNESQSDYYRYLTGYRRMDPNQAILSMGLDPNKYYYQHDPAYYH